MLFAFQNIWRTTNLASIGHAAELPGAAGSGCTMTGDDTANRMNPLASTGRADVPGAMLPGHTDVVPVAHSCPRIMPSERCARCASAKQFAMCSSSARLSGRRAVLTRRNSPVLGPTWQR